MVFFWKNKKEAVAKANETAKIEVAKKDSETMAKKVGKNEKVGARVGG